MAFDFPASPAVGTVSNGYTYDGIGWAGGPGVSGPQTEQYFDVSGLAVIDIPVPAWAKSMVLRTQVANATASAQVNLRTSGDGTTFPSGASDYTIGGFSQQAQDNTYPSQIMLAINRVPLNIAMLNATIPNLTEVHMIVGKPSSTISFAGRMVSSVYSNTATITYNHRFHSFYVNATMGGVNQLKAIRIYTDLGTWQSGSHIKVEWIGDSAAIPTTNAIADCPADGNEYVRCNGVWRLKKQEFVWTGNSITIPVPTSWTPKRVKIDFYSTKSGAALSSVGLQTSQDGTTFQTGASDYATASIYGQGNTTPVVGYQQIIYGNSAWLTYDADNAGGVPQQGTYELELAATSGVCSFRGIGTNYNNAANTLQRTYVGGGWSVSSPTIKAFRIFYVNAAVTTASGRVMTEWS